MSARAAWHIGNIAHLPREERPVWVHQLRTQRFDSLAGVSVEDLHQMQIEWYRRDAASFQAYLRHPAKSGDKHDPHEVLDEDELERLLDAQVIAANEFATCRAEERRTFHAFYRNGIRACWTCGSQAAGDAIAATTTTRGGS
jgi:hypothetical protein